MTADERIQEYKEMAVLNNQTDINQVEVMNVNLGVPKKQNDKKPSDGGQPFSPHIKPEIKDPDKDEAHLSHP